MIRYDVIERIEVGDMQIISANPVKDKVVIKVRCPICGKQTILDMTYTQWRRYMDGKELVQQIFPEKSASARELLISGICSKCWDDMFS